MAATMAQVALGAAAEAVVSVAAMFQVAAVATPVAVQVHAIMQQVAAALTTQAQPNPTQGTITPATAQ